MNKYTKEDTLFIVENYPKNGTEYCANALNISNKTVTKIVNFSKLKLTKKTKSETQSKNSSKYEYVNKNEFIKLDNPIIIYLMGLMWADGYLHSTLNRLELCILEKDYEDISEIINSLGEWSIVKINRKNRKTSIRLGCYSKDICDIFKKYNYHNKSVDEPLFIKNIPTHLIYYFFRGLVDGDGCFYLSKDKKQRQFYLAGTYEQNWQYFEDYLIKNNIKYIIHRKEQKNKEQKNSKYSIVYIGGCDNIKNFGELIFENFSVDKIGLTRKYLKFNDIISK